MRDIIMPRKAPDERLFHAHGAPGYYKEQVNRALASGRISDQDKDLILKYISYRHSNKPITELRKTKIAQMLVGWRQFITVPWNKCTIDDVREGMTRLSESKYAQNTQHDYWKDLKPYVKWLNKKQIISIDLDDLKEISGAGINTESHSASDLLSVDEIEQMIRASGSTRNRAIVSLLFESAARIYELARLQWRDIDFTTPSLIQLEIYDSKTDKKRNVPLIKNVAYLGAWRNEYKGFTGRDPTLDDYVFVDESGQMMRYPAIRQVVVRSAVRAGLNGKRVHPHLLRASAITQFIREGYRESTVREIAWGNQGTDMFKHYLKLSSEDINREFRQKAGIETVEDQKDKPRVPVICPHCSSSNPPSAKFCLQCGAALSSDAIKAKQKISSAPGENKPDRLAELAKLLADPEVQKFIQEREKKI